MSTRFSRADQDTVIDLANWGHVCVRCTHPWWRHVLPGRTCPNTARRIRAGAQTEEDIPEPVRAVPVRPVTHYWLREDEPHSVSTESAEPGVLRVDVPYWSEEDTPLPMDTIVIRGVHHRVLETQVVTDDHVSVSMVVMDEEDR